MPKGWIDQRQDRQNSVKRRDFLKIVGVSALGASGLSAGHFKGEGVAIIVDPTDSVAGSAPVRWATDELMTSISARGIAVHRYESLIKAAGENFCIAVASADASFGKRLLDGTTAKIPAVAEGLGLVPTVVKGKKILIASGRDVRGLVYALLELSDRVNHSTEPLAALNFPKPVLEQPANSIRSLNRLFVSDIEDKPWYNDREMWPKYLTMLATQRFNRFNLSFGIGYDFLRQVTDGYFLFAYPFLLSVPGYNVRVPELPDSERDRNLEMLKFISEQTVARGLQFQLGIWMHGYEWLNSPNPNYTIEGLTPETHGPYCRDAVRQLLRACPAISGITFRVHGESGVNEGSYNFWKTVFEGVSSCGRRVEIDMHAKGMDQEMIDLAVATGMPVNIAPKYWAEHMGMPYHQADIRALEIPKAGKSTSRLMNLSAGSRSFIRYGYGDLLRENRRYGVLHRIWPGTQRLLLWGDPLVAAAHSKSFSFCGSMGAELMEPLSFKGRRGSGIAGDRCGYVDASLSPRWDWEKYLYSLRVFGRLLYNPDAEPDVWRRYLRKEFRAVAESTEGALANATRILPIVLTSHGPSAANNSYWPEMYTNQPIADPDIRHPYRDTPTPRVFGNVSPFDPQLFANINDFAAELLKGQRSGKYSPIEAAQWIEDYADKAARHLKDAETRATRKDAPEFRRMAIDVSIQVGLGRFFSAKFRSGVLYAIFEQSGDRAALEEALKAYQRARRFWAELANQAKEIYQPDISVGDQANLRGHWLDRLPAIDADIAFMAKRLNETETKSSPQNGIVQSAIRTALGRPNRPSSVCYHTAQERFRVGQPLSVKLSFERMPATVRLHYRHVNHAERYETLEMRIAEKYFEATIPSAYTDSQYPIQYYFELSEGIESAWLFPGFDSDLINQPYFVVRPS